MNHFNKASFHIDMTTYGWRWLGLRRTELFKQTNGSIWVSWTLKIGPFLVGLDYGFQTGSDHRYPENDNHVTCSTSWPTT
jgi:hypothetical protein